MTGDAMKRSINEQDEFLLSRLLDGDLTREEEATLRARIEAEPELRRSFRAMSRVDDLLRKRRNAAPAIDFESFRGDVMDQVHAERRPATLKFVRWAAVAVPLAMAAAIALVVTLYRPAPAPDQPIIATGPEVVTPSDVPAPNPTGTPSKSTLIVQYNRPDLEADTGSIQVSYAQSSGLAKAMEERDTERRSRPAYHLVMTEASPPVRFTSFDLPPL
jgi:anti-sigma factor RsiW